MAFTLTSPAFENNGMIPAKYTCDGAPPAGGGTPGATTRGELKYTGPCPPPEYEPSEHRYIFKLYALLEPLTLKAGATKEEVLDALAPVVLAETELIGRYSRK